MYPALQLARKFWFAFVVVVLKDYWVLQLGYIFLSSTLMIYITSLYHPYTSFSLNRLQIFHDIVLVILSDFMIAFNGGGFISTDQNVRFIIGWIYSAVLFGSLAVSFLIMVFITLKTVQRTVLIKEFRKSK